MRRTLFRALEALAVDDGRCRTSFAIGLFTAQHVKRVVQLIERAVILPAAEIAVHRAAWRQVFWEGVPLAAGAQHIHQPIHHRALVHTALVAASPGARDLRPDSGNSKRSLLRSYRARFPIVHMQGFCKSVTLQGNHKGLERLKMILHGHLEEETKNATYRWVTQ
jgi:hypothetical protein